MFQYNILIDRSDNPWDITIVRLWMMRREESIEEGNQQTLKHIDFTPRLDVEDDKQRFKKLDVVLERINREIQSGKTDLKMGEIITIETLYFPVATSEWKIDYTNSAHLFPSRCVSIIRIFYSEAPTEVTTFPLIGIKDFAPKQISGGSFFKRPVFEQFSDVLSRASDWISQNPDHEFKNAQCLEVKMKSMNRIDTKIMSHNADRGDYIRIFRVAFTKRPEDHGSSPEPSSSSTNGATVGENYGNPPPAPIFLSTIIFTPADPDATVQEIRRKIHEWVEVATREVRMAEGMIPAGHRPRLLSAETVEIFTKDFTEDEIRSETENTFKPNRIGTLNQFLFMAFRIYFDVGFFGRNDRSRSICSTVSSPGHKPNHPSCQMM